MGIRTEPITTSASDHNGFGAGSGTTERYAFRCPCGEGQIVEEHDNIPGFRDHSVMIQCEKCRSEWQFVEGKSTREWELEPKSA